MKNRLIVAIFIASAIIVFSSVGAGVASAPTKLEMRASSGWLSVDDHWMPDADTLIRVSMVKKGDVCYASLNVASKGEDKQQKVFFRIKLSSKDGCEISENMVHFSGQGAVTYRSLPKVIKRPLVDANGRIYWERDVTGEPKSFSEQMPVELAYQDGYLSIDTPTGFFYLEGAHVDKFVIT